MGRKDKIAALLPTADDVNEPDLLGQIFQT